MTRTSFRTIGFIGLGVMGLAECSNLSAKSGAEILAYDTASDAAERCAQAGALLATSLTEAVQTADVVFLSLPGEPEVEQVALAPNGVVDCAQPGTVVVDLSTVPVDLARRAGARAEDAGLSWVDAPVARTHAAAVKGTLSITAGGPIEAFERVHPLLLTMATDVVHCGRNGAGALMKLINNLVVFETVVALSEAAALVRKSGLIDLPTAFDALAHGSAASFALENHGRKAIVPDEHPEGLFPARYMAKDIGYALDLADELGLDLYSARLAALLLESAIESGYGSNYHTVVSRVIAENTA